MSDRLVLELTEEIYAAATGDTPWGAVGAGLMRLVGAQSGSIMVGHHATGDLELLYHGNLPLDAMVPYLRHYRAVDLWTNRVATAVAADGPRHAALPKVWVSGTLVPDSEFLNSEFYNDFGRRLGLRYVVGTVLPLGDAGVMPIGLHRPDGAAPFEQIHAEMLGQVMPHLRRAIQLRHRLAVAESSAPPSLAALDALAAAVLVLDAEMHVLVANTAAEAMAGPGGAIRLMAGRPGNGSGRGVARALHHGENAALAALVRATALQGAPGGAVPLRDADGWTVAAALVSPLPRRLSESRGAMAGRVAGQALVLLRELKPQGAGADPRHLREIFGLTAAEAEVACALIGGATKEAVAARRNLQVSTINTQVRAILEKTGATNLRDLERLLGGLFGR